ncbi:methyltransferase domain-containing protein [Glaciihabitans arcticus]|uniref:Methyltransferase domain-containing protein n=1 Tax=Glaciihabitans arcticus TaxID=2668039 RepID=A0A4Q9GXB8_9MICO|nr:PIG-L family deacetylase [Glaciihabitans arcticus]TBN56910.1 methyltransferase domain-containing protein [Glaciihabitans arcticus]
MVTFDSTLPGTSAEAWEADGRLARLPALSLDGIESLVVVAAHPDDEALGAGGLIAECAARGIRVLVVTVTDGAASHPSSPSTPAHDLAARRAEEARTALAELAPDAGILLLAHPDGSTLELRETIAADLARAIPATGPSTLLVAPWSGDGHRDHRIVGELCAELAATNRLRFAGYPIWLWHWAEPEMEDVPWDSFVSLPLEPAAAGAKHRAIAAHVSQVEPLSESPGDEALLHPRFLANFERRFEVFVQEPTTLGADYFDAMYARRDDPWGFESRWYERRKRAITLAALPEERYTNALEIGCSIGVLTADLAERCDALLSTDVSSAAIESAKQRLAASPHVRFETGDVASSFPDGRFDLIVLSEVGYYFDAVGLDALVDAVAEHLAEGGTLLACHWRHPVADYPLDGDEVHVVLAARLGLERVSRHLEKDFVLDVFNSDGRSVAERTGLV